MIIHYFDKDEESRPLVFCWWEGKSVQGEYGNILIITDACTLWPTILSLRIYPTDISALLSTDKIQANSPQYCSNKRSEQPSAPPVEYSIVDLHKGILHSHKNEEVL